MIPNLSFSCVEDVRQLGVAQQRLGRDAADVEADAAPVLLLDDRDLHAELGGADGGDVPTGAGTEDDDVEVLAHGTSLGGAATSTPRERWARGLFLRTVCNNGQIAYGAEGRREESR